MYLAEYRDWPPHQKLAMQYAPGKVLDVGCGAGRDALYLQRRGHDVLGIDSSPRAVEVCRLRGQKQVRRLPITRVSSALGIFRTILMLGNNFGLFANARRAAWLLRRFHRATDQYGRIIAESLDPHQTGNPSHRAYHRHNRRNGRLAGQVRIRVRYQNYTTDWFDYLFVSRAEMKRLLQGTGWAVKRFIPRRGPLYVAVIAKVESLK